MLKEILNNPNLKIKILFEGDFLNLISLKKMKINNILIFALFISFNYSVYSEDNKEAKKGYNLSDELEAIIFNLKVTSKEFVEISGDLLKTARHENSGNFTTYDNMDEIVDEFDDVINRAYNLLIFLSYERTILLFRENTSNVSLIDKHNFCRRYFIENLESKLDIFVKRTKLRRIRIQNTTAVIAINKSLELVAELQKWLVINKKPVLKALP